MKLPLKLRSILVAIALLLLKAAEEAIVVPKKTK